MKVYVVTACGSSLPRALCKPFSRYDWAKLWMEQEWAFAEEENGEGKSIVVGESEETRSWKTYDKKRGLVDWAIHESEVDR